MTRSDRFDTQKIDAIAQLAGAVANDFNALLTSILEHAEQLSDDIGPGDPRAVDLEGIRNAAQLAASLTAQLLAVSRQQTRTPAIVNLNDVVEGIRGVLQRLAGDRLDFTIDADTSLDPVRADVEQIEHVLLNLVVNACDATPSGGALTIETRNVFVDEAAAARRGVAPAAYVELAVADTGVGIDPSIRPHLFEPFVTTKEPGRAAGLGLATVHGIVTQNGGHIVVESEVGRGSRFAVYLPATTAACSGDGATTGAVKDDSASATVLLFEDDQAVQSIVADVLRRRGYQLLVAADEGEAVRLAAEHATRIDLLVADVATTPDRDPAVVDAVRRHRPSMRVLYLTKPFTPDALARRVRAALESA